MILKMETTTMSQPSKVFKFTIERFDIKPSIWRTFEVPSTYTFWDLHVAIQDAMGWQDCHLHSFNSLGKIIGIPDDSGFMDDDRTVAGWETPLTNHFLNSGDEIEYEYDFGDGWRHLIRLESISEGNLKNKYPTCIDGENACPPEDCGGIYGYQDLLRTLKKPKTQEYKDLMGWLKETVKGKFIPDHFNPKKVKFHDPKDKLKLLQEYSF